MCNCEGPPLKKRKPEPLRGGEPYPIYLDYNATTPLCGEAWAAMARVHNVWGNPSSSHPYGLAAKHALEEARETIRRALGAADAQSIVLTSGGTESNNLAIIGGARCVAAKCPHKKYIVSSNCEHPAVAEVLKFLGGNESFAFLTAPVNPRTGCLDADLLEQFLNEKVPGGPANVAVVTVMFANNELGSVNPIKELVEVVKRLCGEDTLFHSDAAQALGKVPVLVSDTNVDLLSVCGHKFYAPKGSGALYVKPGVAIRNITFGAGHERGVRPGTENVLLATGMAEALSYAVSHLVDFAAGMRATRDELARVLREELAKNAMDYIVNGDVALALPNTLNCAVRKKVPNHKTGEPYTYISAQRLILAIGDQVCISAGSACHSTAGDEEIEVSAPLKAVGVDLNRAIGTLRMSTGRGTTMEEVRRAARIIARQAAQQFAE